MTGEGKFRGPKLHLSASENVKTPPPYSVYLRDPHILSYNPTGVGRLKGIQNPKTKRRNSQVPAAKVKPRSPHLQVWVVSGKNL